MPQITMLMSPSACEAKWLSPLACEAKWLFMSSLAPGEGARELGAPVRAPRDRRIGRSARGRGHGLRGCQRGPNVWLRQCWGCQCGPPAGSWVWVIPELSRSMGLPVRSPSGVASAALCALPCMRQQCQRGGLQGRVFQVPLGTSVVPAWTIRKCVWRATDCRLEVRGAGRDCVFFQNLVARRGQGRTIAKF